MPQPLTRAAIVSLLKLWARPQTSEGFSDADLESLVEDTVVQHNESYVCTDTACTVPTREREPVRLLCLYNFCLLRAQRHAQLATTKTGDFSENRDTPFAKNMKLADTYRSQYEKACAKLGLTSNLGVQSVHSSSLVTLDNQLGAEIPVDMSLEPPSVQLSGERSGATVTLTLATTQFSNFATRYVFFLNGSVPLHAPWLIDSNTGVPRVANGAAKLMTTQNQRYLSFRVVLDPVDQASGSVLRFLIVTRSLSDVYGYSNELVIEIP